MGYPAKHTTALPAGWVVKISEKTGGETISFQAVGLFHEAEEVFPIVFFDRGFWTTVDLLTLWGKTPSDVLTTFRYDMEEFPHAH